MPDVSNGSRAFSRRNFITGAALIGATGALIGCSPQGGSSEEKPASTPVEDTTELYAGVCRGNCAGGCFLNVHVRDGQVVRTTARDLPNESYNRICSKGVTHVGRIYSANRLQYPMRRVGERGAGEFERITWDEAINEVATKWMELSNTYGPASMAVQYGSGNYAICSGVGLGGAADRFINVTGAAYIPNNVDAAHGFVMAAVPGMGLYGTQNEPADFLNCDTIICWGANPAISQVQVMHFILEAKDNGTKYIVIDPAYNANTAKADTYIPINPSTDGALAFGVLNHIFENDWVNVEYAKAHTESPLLIKADGMLLHLSDLGVEPTVSVDEATGAETTVDPYAVYDEDAQDFVALEAATNPALTGITEANGIAVTTTYDNLKAIAATYTDERVTQLTGVPAETIAELARIYHEVEHINTYMMFGDNHYINGHYNYWPIYAISFLTGHMGAEGNACGFAEMIPVTANMAATLYPFDSAGNMCQGPGPTYIDNKINEVIDTGSYGWEPAATYDPTVPASANVDLSKPTADVVAPLKGVYVMCSNPLANHADHDYTVNWFNKLDFVVVADMCMTETARYADILLPSAHWFEQTDLFTSYANHPYLLLQEKATEPLYESKSDFQILKALCEAMGYGEFWNLTEEEFIQTWLESDTNLAMGISYAGLMENKWQRQFPTDPFVSHAGGVFSTATGRGRLYIDTPAPAYNVGQPIDYSREMMPYWEPALEADVNSAKRTGDYPFYLLSEHMRTRTHAQWWDVDYLKEYEPEPVIKINPDDAADKGIAEGDNVRVFNDRGYVVMKAVINAGLPRGMVAAPRSFNAHEFIDGHYASLPTNQFNQVVANVSFNDVAVNIEKA